MSPKSVPISMGPSGTTLAQGSASSSGAPGQIVPADTLASDLDHLTDVSMISLEDFIDEQLVPISSVLDVSGTKVIAPADRIRDDLQSISQSSSSGTKVLAPKGSSSSSNDAIVAADMDTDLAQENARLRKALEAKDIELYETKIHAENYAHKALQDSRSKAEQALAFQKGTFETAHE